MKRCAIGFTIVIGAALSGCASHYDARFGDAVRQAQAAQVLNPQAGRDGGHAKLALDGQAAVNAVVRYRASFSEPPPAFTIIGLGTQGSSAR
jgi:hypothetical protein